jgi:signal recognition particle receptor subunit beta
VKLNRKEIKVIFIGGIQVGKQAFKRATTRKFSNNYIFTVRATYLAHIFKLIMSHHFKHGTLQDKSNIVAWHKFSSTV